MSNKTMEVLVSLLLTLLYIGSCLYAYRGFKERRYHLPFIYLIFVITVPFLGVILLHFLEKQDLFQKGGTFVHQEDLSVPVEKRTVNKQLTVKEDQKTDVTPLEESLLLEDSATSRKVLLEIIGDQPEEFLDLLYLSRLNEDSEVVHYASSIIAELSHQYDIQLAQLEKELSLKPDNYALLTDYCRLLGKYLSTGLIGGEMAKVLRRDYATQLEKKLAQRDSLSDYVSLVENELLLQRYDRAEAGLEKMVSKWPREEETWLLRLNYYLVLKEGQKVEELLTRMKKENIYISTKNKMTVDFWAPA
ncbi:hypothetical protein ACVRZS_01340 [Streptococcus ferus]|nr:hypothetical protein [Streptococcus ferus]